MFDRENLLNDLNDRLKHSQDVFMVESGGKSQCEIGRCRVPSLTVKKAEGSMHALIDLLRVVSDQQAHDSGQLRQNLLQLMEKWLAVSQLSDQWKA